MKNSKCNITGFLFTFFILNSSLLVPDCMSQWVLSGNAPPGTNLALTANSNTIFAAALYNGIYKSTNNGTNWSSSLPLFVSGYTLAANGNNIFVGGNNAGVFYSSDNGAGWLPTSLTGISVFALTINGNQVFAGTQQNGVYITINNGANWTQTSLNNRSVLSFAVKGDTIFAGTQVYGVYISTNNGTNWTQTSLNNLYIHSLAVYGNNVFAGTSGSGIWLTTNNGTNWTQVGLNGQSIWSIAVYENTIFAGSYTTGVYVSYDNGATWTPRSEGLGLGGALNIRALCILGNYIFTTPQSRVYRRPLSELTGFQPVSNEIPKQFSLSQNYPNPFNPVTNIEFRLPERVFVSLRVYDAMGREIQTLVKGELYPGTYRAEWNAANYSSGVYFYTLVSGNFTETRKMVIAK